MITLRAATSADVDDILALWAVAAENDSRPVDRPEAVLALIRHDFEALLLAVDAGVLVGTLAAGWDGWRAHLYRLAVHPSARRRGIARLLLERAEDRFDSLGAGRVDAMVLATNELGQRLWQASGYTAQDDWRRWVKPVG